LLSQFSDLCLASNPSSEGGRGRVERCPNYVRQQHDSRLSRATRAERLQELAPRLSIHAQ
jgi:hypothetical protein